MTGTSRAADAAPPVALVRWPRDADRRDELAAARRPRVLLVPPGTAAPADAGVDPLEDWVRLPADELELSLRIRHVAAAAGIGFEAMDVVAALTGWSR